MDKDKFLLAERDARAMMWAGGIATVILVAALIGVLAALVFGA